MLEVTIATGVVRDVIIAIVNRKWCCPTIDLIVKRRVPGMLGQPFQRYLHGLTIADDFGGGINIRVVTDGAKVAPETGQ